MASDGYGFLGGISIADQVNALGGRGRGGGTRKLAEARAQVSGKSVRTEMRAVQRALKSGRAPVKQAPQVARAGAAQARAAQIRRARRVNVGRVKVYYIAKRGAPRFEGERDLASFGVSGELESRLAEAADLIEAGDREAAQDLISEALLDEYGDLGGTLEISEFMDGMRFE